MHAGVSRRKEEDVDLWLGPISVVGMWVGEQAAIQSSDC